ncbi:MAG: hypothetical protein WAM04_06690 [Candidatus Sulfotelmatobacter sp.]
MAAKKQKAKKRKAKKQPAKKQPAKKQPPKKQPPKKQPPKKQPPKKQPPKKQPPKKNPPKKLPTTITCDESPDICISTFTASNGDHVCFQNIPTAGVTITQISGETFPFVPTGTNSQGLKYTDVATGGYATVSVPTLNQKYPYDVSVSCGPDEGNHSVTVNS